ncbi:MAG: hypothetical protein V4570_07170 [Pseudomonadota bacterium]
MVIRKNKDAEIIVKIAINLALNISYKSATQLMSDAGISEIIIERILYDPNNVRKTDLDQDISFTH